MKKTFIALKDFCAKKTVHVITILISTALTIPFMIWGTNVLSVLSGIGCSGIAAGIMAIFIDAKIDKDRKSKVDKAKHTYFKKLYDELVYILQRVLWFDERAADNSFNWDLPPDSYSQIGYMVFASNYPKETISFDDAMTRLEQCSKKYTLEEVRACSDKDKERIYKMFRIIAASAYYLKTSLKTVKQNEIMLNIEDYISLEKVNDLDSKINLALALMEKPDKNYSLAINFLSQAAKSLREECDFQNDFQIAILGSYPMSDI